MPRLGRECGVFHQAGKALPVPGVVQVVVKRDSTGVSRIDRVQRHSR
jgi:hypothetical protein